MLTLFAGLAIVVAVLAFVTWASHTLDTLDDAARRPVRATAAGSSWRVISGAFRLVGCFVGIIALLKLAAIGFRIQFEPFFEEFIQQCRNWTEVIVLLPILEPAAHWCIDRLREMNLSVPDLQPHWRQVFTLQWLLLAAVARNFPGHFVTKFMWAAVCAFAAAVAVGTQPLNSAAVYAWPLAIFLVFMVIQLDKMGGSLSGRPKEGVPLPGGDILLFIAFILLLWGYGWDPMESFFGVAVDNPGLLVWACLVGLMGLYFGAYGWLTVRWLRLQGRWSGRDRSGLIATSLDVVGTMGMALGLAYIFRA